MKHDNPYVRLRALAQATLVGQGDIEISATGVSNTFKVTAKDAEWPLFIYAMITHLDKKACAFEAVMAELRNGKEIHSPDEGRRRSVLRRDSREDRRRYSTKRRPQSTRRKFGENDSSR